MSQPTRGIIRGRPVTIVQHDEHLYRLEERDDHLSRRGRPGDTITDPETGATEYFWYNDGQYDYYAVDDENAPSDSGAVALDPHAGMNTSAAQVSLGHSE